MTAIRRAFADWQEHVRRNQLRLAALIEIDNDEPAPGRKSPPKRALSMRFAVGSAPPEGGSRGLADARIGIAMGAQAAVVKLASFAGGRARVGALLHYQSRDGALELEREDGSLIQGAEAVQALAEEWDEERGRRKPSNDVLYFTVAIGSDVSQDAMAAALGQAIAGHQYAWRVESQDGERQLHVVASAASSVRGENGRAQRLFDNNKSMNALHDRLDAAFGADVGFEERGWAHGVDGAARLLCRLTRDGATPATASSGKPIDCHEAHWEVANAWKRSLRSREQRDVAHVILSAKPGTDRDAFEDAARAMLAREFAGHEYAFALHTDRKHLHVHAVVRTLNADGHRLHPGVGDFNRWRQTMAQEARLRHIPMEAVSRFEQAHAPAYKLRDVQMIERGNAPEHVRRRVEAVKTKAIHVPTRPEGRERARQAVNGWTALSETPLAGEELAAEQRSPVAFTHADILPFRQRVETAHARARGSEQTAASAVEPDDRPTRRRRRKSRRPNSQRAPMLIQQKAARLAAIDADLKAVASTGGLSEDDARRYGAARAAIAKDFDNKIAAARQQEAPPAHKHERSSPPDPLSPNPETQPIEETDMANIALARKAAKTKLESIDIMAAAAPVELRAEFAAARERVRLSMNKVIEAAEAAEANRAQMSGPFSTPLQARAAPGFVLERVRIGDAEEARHYHVGEDGSRGALAFVDRGRVIDVKDWKSEEAIGAAMKLAADKWGAVTLAGNDSYKQSALRIAAARGYEIANPELRERYAGEKARAEAQTQFAAPSEITAPPPHAMSAHHSRVAPSPASAPNARDAAERQLALDEIRERVDAEARRETRQANVAGALGETNAATGDAAHPYRSQAEATAARQAARAEDNNPDRPMPANPSQSLEIQQARFEQQKLLDQQAQQQRQAEKTFAEILKEKEREIRERDRALDWDHDQEM